MIGIKMIQFMIFITLSFCNYSFASQNKNTFVKFDVRTYGAQPGGVFDSTQAFIEAWNDACRSEARRVKIYVPQEVFLLGNAAVFDGSSCEKEKILFQFRGSTLLAPSDYHAFHSDENNWLMFYKVNRLTIRGGTINGMGASLWKCKESKNDKDCPIGVTSLGLYYSNNIIVKGVTFVDSEMFHSVAYNCIDVDYVGITIIAPEKSPNTDGIHLQLSSGVKIRDSFIGTGDDCVSIGGGTTDVLIQGVYCGPGHGISIGSLCRDGDEKGVQNVTVKNATLIGTQNGLRIKVWSKPCNSFVRDVLYQDIFIDNAGNPIILTTNYCPDNNCPREGESTVDIGNIAFRNIKGKSASSVAVQIHCPIKRECHNITMDGVEIKYRDEEPATASCSNAEVFLQGNVIPLPENCKI